MHDGAFLSTTLSRSIAKGFQSKSCCVFKIKIPPESRVIPMIPITRYSAEVEILLPGDREVLDVQKV
jgi:hypothetical protein